MLATLFFAAVSTFQGPASVQVTTTEGQELTGSISIKRLTLTTDFGSAQVQVDKLEFIEFGKPDLLMTTSGFELRGQLKLSTLILKTDKGRKSLRRANLASLAVLRDGAAGGGGGRSFAGDWMGSFGPMTLAMRGRTVKGTYGHDGNGEIEGRIKGNELTFEYRDSSGSGKGTFELFDDGSAFTGSFGNDRFWGAYRLQPRAAKPAPGKITAGQTKSGMNYHLRVPKGWDGKQQLPAIAFLHGSNMSSRSYVATIASAWPDLAKEYVLVGFDGEKISRACKPDDRRYNFSYINFGGPDVGPKWARRQSPALVAEGLDEVQEQLNLKHWFLGGHSQGGFLTYAVMMFFPEKLAGAFPMSCNLLVQCEPDNFKDDSVRKQQRNVAVAAIHGENDNVVEFSSGEYCFRRLIDGGFPTARFFTDKHAAHMFARLPVQDAIRWLEAMTSGDKSRLIELAGEEIKENRYRSASAALQRARSCGAGRNDVQALEAKIDAKAKTKAAALEGAIRKSKNNAWVDDFLKFRREFAFAGVAQGCMKAYADLRKEHQDPADELFYAARREQSKDARNEKYREIIAKYYASKWYESVKGWIK